MPRDCCPICDSPKTQPFLRRNGVPVHQNMPFADAVTARQIRRGELDMRACPACGFIYNAAFDPSLLDYGPNYENSQCHSAAFSTHMDDLIKCLLADGCGTVKTVVEVGCGKGAFLLRLCGHPSASCSGVGYDPAYTGPETALDGRIRFMPTFYGPDTSDPADVVICRHVIEHVADPLELLRTFRAAAPDPAARVYLETPCAEWIIANRVPWDFFYEHCSLFTGASLSLALERVRFGTHDTRHLFGGQYLWGMGTGIGKAAFNPPSTDLVTHAIELGKAEAALRRAWKEIINQWSSRGTVYAWGAGAKGVTFCNLMDPDQSSLRGVIDVNPAKQGRYLPGTGHPIISPTGAIGAAAVLIFNPNYVEEIRAAICTISPRTEVINLMEAATCV